MKTIRMSMKHLYLIILLVLVGCHQTGIGQDKVIAAKASNKQAKIPEKELSKQLKINKDALFSGSSEQIRIDSATVMLYSKEILARRVLLDALTQSENSDTRVAVCKALSQARGTQEPIKKESDFIQPLLDIIASDVTAESRLAAEALLIFEYDQIAVGLEKIALDSSSAAEARVNAIYALKLQPDKRVIFKLIDLLNAADSRIALASEQALKSLGIPIAGKDANARQQIIKELNQKGRDEFLRDWVIRQESEMDKLEAEMVLWRNLYVSALNKIYKSFSGETERGDFLAENLASSELTLKLWALEKVEQWRKGTNPNLPVKVKPLLINLISDENKDIRFKTAKLLALMVELNSAQQLLGQLEIEKDDEVRMELFIALGGTCHYAISANSEIDIPNDIRASAMEWAVKYLYDIEPKKSQKGAEVIRKLLEQNGLSLADVDKYLGQLVERYALEKDKADGILRGELLGEMAGLCAHSAYEAEAKKIFKPLFEDGLNDESDLVRQGSVDGLIYIDKTRALNKFREKLINDSSVQVQEKVINLAGEVGSDEDLVWLAEKTGTTAESELAWQAMLKIFKSSKAAILNRWIPKFDSQEGDVHLADEQKVLFFELAEKKAVGENDLKMQSAVRGNLADIYARIGEYKQAVNYLGILLASTETDEERELILGEMLDVYLRWPNMEAAIELVSNSLQEKDMKPESFIARIFDKYFAEQTDEQKINAVIEELAKIKTSEGRPKWKEYLNSQLEQGNLEPVSEANQTNN